MTGSAATKARPKTGAAKAKRQHAGTAERRTDVLKAAMQVFGSRGYHNGSLAEIAAQAGMTNAGVLHYFGSKEQLLVSVLEYRDDADVANLDGQRAPRGREFLKHLCATVRENTTRAGLVQAYAVLSAESVTDGHPAQAFFRARYVGLRRMVVEALSLTVGDAAPPAQLERTAAAIVAVMDGLQVQWLLAPDAVEMPESVELVIDSLLLALTKAPAGTARRGRARTS